MTILQRTAPCPPTTARYLNLGCGSRFHPAWSNVDVQPVHPSIRRHDVTRPLPFLTRHFDAVYCSHLLEHLPRRHVPAFLAECRRVLRGGGVLRLAVPDLEQMARLYLQAFESAWEGDAQAQERHLWLTLEMFDQTTREHSGGDMLTYLERATPANLAWYRVGADGAVLRSHLERAAPTRSISRWRQRLRGWLLGSWRERLVRRLLGREYELLQVGRFRRGGEVHHAMYDRVSLRALLTTAGFVQFRCVRPVESAIPGWTAFGLDVQADGVPAKPDSLYVEAIKP